MFYILRTIRRSGQPLFAPKYGVPLSKKDWVDIKALGANVRRERIKRNLTQEKLAELADLHLRSLQKIEAGEINLLITTVLRIKRGLKCSWEALLG